MFVQPTRELWITRGAPPLGIASADCALTIVDASDPDAPRVSGAISLAGSAEGYAVDAAHGTFYTNLEESAETVAIDVHTHAVRGRWRSGCREPHGLALDSAHGLVLVACDDSVIALDPARGVVTGTIETGTGVDNIDYDEPRHLVLAAAQESGTLTIGRVDDAGRIAHVATVATAPSTRGVVAGANGAMYVADPRAGRILKITHRQ